MTRFVLYHLSHCSSTIPDGWSGAPGEAGWVRELVALVTAKAAAQDIVVETVDGDLQDHPAFHDPRYEAFVAPHYESDTHGDHARGWLWGRAAASSTAADDDRLGAIFERRYRDLVTSTAGPAEHPEWMTVNIADYYGFRLDRVVPGILVEHGIGAPGAADFDWLRFELDVIAGVHVATLEQFLGIAQETEVDELTPELKAYLEERFGALETEMRSGFNVTLKTMLRRIARGLGGHRDPDVAYPDDNSPIA